MSERLGLMVGSFKLKGNMVSGKEVLSSCVHMYVLAGSSHVWIVVGRHRFLSFLMACLVYMSATCSELYNNSLRLLMFEYTVCVQWL